MYAKQSLQLLTVTQALWYKLCRVQQVTIGVNFLAQVFVTKVHLK